VNPDFIIIGAPKAGTTSLWRLIAQHPQIVPCATKEPAFFMRDEIYARGWDWYQNLFPGKQPGQISGEATTEYSQTRSFPKTVSRIAKHVPEAKLIFIMRHPFETLESRWRQSLHNRDPIPSDFATAVKEYPPLMENVRFAETIDDFLEHFQNDKMLLLLFEDFKDAPNAMCKKVFDFLEIASDYEVEDADKRSNSASEKNMDTGLVSALRQIPLMNQIKNLFPRNIRSSLRWATRVTAPDPVWTEELVQLVNGEIHLDAQRALKLAGKESDYWDLSSNWNAA